MADQDDLHLDRMLLLAAYRGEVPMDFIHQLGLTHLLELCPHCRREVQAFRASLRPDEGSARVFSLALKHRLADLRRQHDQAERELRVLLALPLEERIPAIRCAWRDAATAELVADLTDYLKRARKNPRLRFEPASKNFPSCPA